MSNVTSVSVMVGDTELVFETGKIAKQANGAVYAHYAGSAVIATVCCGAAPSEPIDYVPVSVEYNEKYYAAGKIPGGLRGSYRLHNTFHCTRLKPEHSR